MHSNPPFDRWGRLSRLRNRRLVSGIGGGRRKACCRIDRRRRMVGNERGEVGVGVGVGVVVWVARWQ